MVMYFLYIEPRTKYFIIIIGSFFSMGGLVVKQMLYQAMAENSDNLVKNTVGIVSFS